MARSQCQLRSVEYISSPLPPPPPLPQSQPAATPTNLTHQHQPQQTGFYQHSSPLPAHHVHPVALMPPPTSPLPSQFNGTAQHLQPIIPPPGTPVYPAHQAAVAPHQQPLPATVAQQPGTQQLSQIQLPPPNFGAINSGSYSALSPPSFSWITHTQSPPLHPFPPPPTPLSHVHPITSTPPRLSHSPVISSHAYAAYHDSAYMPQQQQQQHIPPPAILPANPQLRPPNFHPASPHHHNVPDPSSHVSGANLQINSGMLPRVPTHLPILSLPYHQHLCPQEHMPPTVPPHHEPAAQLRGSPSLQIMPAREPWMRSPPLPPTPPPCAPQPRPQQIFQLASHIPMVPQPHSQSGVQPRPLPPQVHIQLLPHAAGRPVAPSDASSRIRGKPVASGHVLTPTAAATTQVSEQVVSTTVQLLQPPLQPVTVSTVVRPTPIYTTQAPPGFQSMSTESGFPGIISGASHLSRQISAEQQRLIAQQEWITARSQAIPPRSGQASSLLMTFPQGSRPDTVLEKTQPLAIPMSSQEAKEVDEYNEFAALFRNHRLRLGYTHADVIQQVGIRYGYFSSLDTLAKFELIQLPLKIVRELKPVLQMWLKDTVKAAGTSEEEMKEIIIHASTSINPKRERKRRTNVDSVIKSQLEEEFRRKRTPSQSEMQAMANRMGMEKEFIRVWFCNRRQRQKKLEKELKAHADRQISSCSPKATIPSPSHDITVEVPSIIPCDMGSPIHECKIIKTS